MGSIQRRDREKQEVRSRIMSAARDLFSAHGVEAVSMRRIADVIEYSPTAIYAYFTDKDDLIRQICDQDWAAFHAAQAAVPAGADPVERVAQMGRVYVRFAVEHPNHFRRMLLDPPDVKPSAEQWAKRGDPAEDGYAFFRSAVAACQSAGRFVAPFDADLDLATQVLWSAVHGVAAIAVAYNDGDSWVTLKPIGELIEATVTAILRGMVVAESPGQTRLPVATGNKHETILTDRRKKGGG